MDRKEFGDRLQSLRESKKPILSRSATSELCGLERGTFARYERGERGPTLEALILIADYFNVSIDYLVGRAEK